MIHLLFLTVLTFVQLNCENLFDCRHDSLKEDTEYTPDGKRQWNRDRYWNKIKNITQELAGCCGKDTLPDLITLCEIENDSVMNDLTRRALLSRLGYRYIMTASQDKRGIDVALLYNVMSFKPINHRSVTPDDNNDTHPLRDLLYVSGRITSGDTLHVIVVHAPSKFGGEKKSLARRMVVMEKTMELVDSIRHTDGNARIIIAGDFNDTAESLPISYLEKQGLFNATKHAKGSHGAQGTYKYKGKWESIDHILVSSPLLHSVISTCVCDSPYLLYKDNKYGGYKPRRTFNGFRYDPKGYSDHLPLLIKLSL